MKFPHAIGLIESRPHGAGFNSIKTRFKPRLKGVHIRTIAKDYLLGDGAVYRALQHPDRAGVAAQERVIFHSKPAGEPKRPLEKTEVARSWVMTKGGDRVYLGHPPSMHQMRR